MTSSSPDRASTTCPSLARMLWRAVCLRCPRCGGRAWIERWFHRLPRCRTCGYKVERQSGFELGAITMNIAVTFGALALTLAVAIVATYPELPAVPTVVATLVVALVVPIVMFPVSQTLWAALDLAMHPLEAAEIADAAAHVVSDGSDPSGA